MYTDHPANDRALVHYGIGVTNCGREAEDLDDETTSELRRVTCAECLDAQTHLASKYDLRAWAND